MTTARPTGFDTFTRPTTGASFSGGTTKASTIIDDLSDGLEAVEVELGAKPGGETRDIYEMLLDVATGHDHDSGSGGGRAVAVPVHTHDGGGSGLISHDTDIADVSADDHHTEAHSMSGAQHTGTATLALQGEEYSELAADYSHPVSNITFANSGLDFDMEASKTYVGEMILWVNAADAGDFKIQLTGPASPTRVRYSLIAPTVAGTGGAGTNFQSNEASATAYSTTLNGGGVQSEDRLAVVKFSIKNGVNAGTVALQFAQRASSGTASIIRAGSYLIAKKVD